MYTGKAEHFRDIYQSIYSIRLLNVSLPVEIWVNNRDHQICSDIFNSLEFPKFSSDSDGSSKARMNIEDKISQAVDVENLINSVKCKKLPNFVQGFTSKFYALLYTTFSDVLFMDADNVAANNVNIIFDSHEYKSTGSILWPDLWGDKCRFDKKNKHPGESSYENHVLFVANFGGLKWQNIRKYAQEAETGQMAFDLTRHRGLLDFGRKFIEDTQFLKKTVNGDKDIFRFMHLISGEPFHFIPHFPGYSFSNHERDCLVHFFGPASSSSSSLISSSSTSFSTSSLSTSSNSSFSGINDNYISHAIYSDESLNSENYEVPMFFHQLKIRNPNAFQQILRIPPNYRNSPSGCLPLGILPDTEESIENEKDVVKEEQIKRKNGRFQRKSHRKLMKTRLRNNIGSKKISIDVNYVLKNSSSIVLSIPIIKSEEIDVDNFPDLIIDKKLLGFESIKRKKNAEKLFKEVDINWQKMNCNRLLWWHNLSIKNSLYPYMPWFLKKKNNGLF